MTRVGMGDCVCVRACGWLHYLAAKIVTGNQQSNLLEICSPVHVCATCHEGSSVMRSDEGLYGETSDGGATLTYHYGEADVAVWPNTSEHGYGAKEPWFQTGAEAKKVTKVIFDDSAIKSFKPDSLYGFFGLVSDWPDMAYGKRNLTTIDGLNEIDVSACKILCYTFGGCKSLTTLDLSRWNTSSVTIMHGIFSGCSSLSSLDLSEWKTPLVKDMTFAFRACSSLKSLDLSGWDTSSVEEMSDMFAECFSLNSLDLSGWKTPLVKNMTFAFRACSSLKSLDLSGWDTSSVEEMDGLFAGCSSLSTLKLGKGFKFVGRGTGLRNDVVWRSSADGKVYKAIEIPNNVAATYTAEPIDTATMHRP